MPIFVDHDEWREKIVDAAIRVLGDLGFAKFTLRAVSNRLGGSVTMVTHYFPSRDALLDTMLQQTLEDARTVQDELIAIEDPHERLEAIVRYFMPDNDEGMAIERARVALVSHRNVEPAIERHLALLEPGMRNLIATAIGDFISPGEIEPTVDLIRLWTSGMVLSAIEHPELWTPERQNAALSHFMKLIDLPVTAA
ncbi:DNA-binding transcriptional regulator, AcrR family [Amycolatopsis tolypomycina]|uniref:DNA-binding transcriptional regulator, AcrR family n=1 Tax=Amycolatopsis tolypomycina TaxID=208445 RepID=A0A1H4Z9Z0_9PSEU|nr:TetR/AcrR family transcriptional regulator [Amycolatopsis tolypomycina]SED26979.1 DNA-binding transcriptional regulator, AcrR family [Amycolatopsis tolypomycina]